MKSLLFTLAVFMLLAQLVSGNWYVKKCLNDVGICKKKCKPEELHVKNGRAMCANKGTAVFQLTNVLIILLSVSKQRLQELQQ
ncbi:LOW QUALITY PROTEIN: beta-defensin 126 [Symphalangus syndactylus]|uniref:LOW QUALITY PROTEIN: beta-defensin 126 n=1 Tax=Symphalangus syndactylus TaxID=9590 RepID=UPI003004202F